MITLGKQVQEKYELLSIEKDTLEEKCSSLESRVKELESENSRLSRALSYITEQYESLSVCVLFLLFISLFPLIIHPSLSLSFSFFFLESN